MLRLYISYAPADQAYLDKLLKWLKPLEGSYSLKITHPVYAPPHLHHGVLPTTQVIYPFHWEKALQQLNKAHIYLFLISYNSLSMPYIGQEEVPRAVERHVKYGEDFVRIFPVLLSPSLWTEYSGLSGFTPLGQQLPLTNIQPEEEGYRQIMVQLRQVVEELQRNWVEETFRNGSPLEDFLQAPQPAPGKAGFKPLPGWVGVVMVLSLFYMVTSFYLQSCAPRIYGKTPDVGFYQDPPERFIRDNPVRQPEDVPLRLDIDTTGNSIPLPKE